VEAPKPAAPAPSSSGGHGHGHGGKPAESKPIHWTTQLAAVLLLGGWTYGMFALKGQAANVEAQNFLQHLTVFVLACFVGWQVVWNVTAALHTPLMSVTNAISGIIIIGGMLQSNGEIGSAHAVLGAFAILLATLNISGGFLVTQRMLKMFRK
jgi:NAD(P) transhydrogenase subunit alpha